MHPNPKYYSIPTLTVTLNPDPKPKANLKAIYNPNDWRGTGTYYHIFTTLYSTMIHQIKCGLV